MYIPGTYTVEGFEDWTIYVIICCLIRRLIDSRTRVKYQNYTISVQLSRERVCVVCCEPKVSRGFPRSGKF